MRALILVASAGLCLASCKDNVAPDNAAVVGDNLAAEAIIANDTTAIDAATSDASNMAADVSFTPADANEMGDSPAPGDRPASNRARRAPAERAEEQTTREVEPAAPMETATENEL